MCDTCGCGDHELVPVAVQQSLLADNDRRAAHNRAHLRASGVTTINLMGSPGCGKTALLEATAARLGGGRLCAVSGDLATDRDAARLREAGVVSAGITTGSACHLDARMLHEAIHHVDLQAALGRSDHFFVENVGNLVCPAIYDLGQDANVVAVAVTEGEDKPLKYPVMFHKADVVLLTKVDLLEHLPDFDVAAFEDALACVMPEASCLRVSAATGAGMDAWLGWLAALRRRTRARPASAPA